MPNQFFKEGDQRAAKVNQLFARIAKRYDLINDLQSFGLHRRWKREVVRMARVTPGAEALDVCCGTGDLALELARSGARVTGLDFTAQMLEVARARAKAIAERCNPGIDSNEPLPLGSRSASKPFTCPKFLEGDALKLPFADNTFDVVTVGYGLRNLADWELGLREMARVTKPGGRLLVLDFGKPENRLWRALYFAYLWAFVPILGLVFCGNASAYAYILTSLKHYPAQHGVAGKMQELGLRNIGLRRILGAVMTINVGEKG